MKAELDLGEHYERFVEQQLESGRYSSASEIVKTALGLLEDFEDAREHWLTELPERYERLLQNPTRGVPSATVRERFEAKHRTRLAEAK